MPSELTVSVALCTFNGGRYLGEQLESIASQTVLPAELVACDDGSTDSTVSILEEFALRARFPVRIFRNASNLGSTKNFEQAISVCQGSIIALCDQDDVWSPEKLDRVLDAFGRRAGIAMVFSNADVVDVRGRPLGYRLWDSRILPIQGRRLRLIQAGRLFDVLLRDNLVTGATMAFRASWRDVLLPIPRVWVQDGWIALLLSAIAPCESVPEPLIRYRQHAAQQLGGRKRDLLQQFCRGREMGRPFMLEIVEKYELIRERLLQRPDGREASWELARKVEHFRTRVRMRDHLLLRWSLAWREAFRGRYRRYSIGWKSFLQDLFLP